MIYLVGGAPRAGKSVLAQRVSAKLRIGWISTDVLRELLALRDAERTKAEWNATPEMIAGKAEKFYPYLERFVWGISSLADNYLIEGVELLPSQVMTLSAQYQVRSVFLGCSEMTMERFDRFPGRSRGYAALPDMMRRQIVHDVPLWSEFIHRQAEQFGYPYIDMACDFPARVEEANAMLTGAAVSENGTGHS